MDRKEFLLGCCALCLGGGAVAGLLESCTPTRIVEASLQGAKLVVPLSEFEIIRKKGIEYRKFLVAQHPKLQFPICIYRLDENRYSALLMRCTHQGTELQVFGDKLQCPAHGSEFDRSGKAENGPAQTPLRQFPVTIDHNQLILSLQ